MVRSILSAVRDLSSIISFGHRRSSILESASLSPHISVCVERHQCGCGRITAGRAVQPGLDKRDLFTRGFRARFGCIWPFDVLEISALVSGCADRCRRRTDSARLSLPSTEPRRIDSAAITHVYGTGGVGVGGPYLL